MDTRQKDERWELLREINKLTEKPMIYLSFLWLVLIVLDFISPANRARDILTAVIWAIFIADFIIEFLIAPRKREYLESNWLIAASLVLPAFRLFRALRAFRLLRTARAARSVRLLRMLGSLNRGIGAIGETFARRGIGYVVLLSALIVFSSAAAMARFESPAALAEAGVQPDAGSSGLKGYGDALWWSAMVMTTMGSEYWPKTTEGRIFGWLLSLYAFSVFGYITATLASHFIGVDAKKEEQ